MEELAEIIYRMYCKSKHARIDCKEYNNQYGQLLDSLNQEQAQQLGKLDAQMLNLIHLELVAFAKFLLEIVLEDEFV